MRKLRHTDSCSVLEASRYGVCQFTGVSQLTCKQVESPSSQARCSKDLSLKASGVVFCLIANSDSSWSKGFIELQVTEQDDLGLMETSSRAAKNKNKKGKKTTPPKRKTAQKQRYVFVPQIIKTKVYQDYFDPRPEVEKRILKLADLVRLCADCHACIQLKLVRQQPKKKARKRPSAEAAASRVETYDRNLLVQPYFCSSRIDLFI